MAKTFTRMGDAYPLDSKYAREMAKYMAPPSFGGLSLTQWNQARDWAKKHVLTLDEMKSVLIGTDYIGTPRSVGGWDDLAQRLNIPLNRKPKKAPKKAAKKPKTNPYQKSLVKKAQYALKMGTLKDAGGASRAEIEAAFKRAEAKARKTKAPKKRARPNRFSVRCHSYQGGYLMFEGSLTRAEADKVYASCKREGYSPVIFDGRKKIK